MNVAIEKKGGSYVLTFVPKDDGDKQTLQAFAIETQRGMSFFCRGFQYMTAAVEFIVQPYSTGRD